jgi:uncharacterized protein with PIN domain
MSWLPPDITRDDGKKQLCDYCGHYRLFMRDVLGHHVCSYCWTKLMFYDKEEIRQLLDERKGRRSFGG